MRLAKRRSPGHSRSRPGNARIKPGTISARPTLESGGPSTSRLTMCFQEGCHSLGSLDVDIACKAIGYHDISQSFDGFLWLDVTHEVEGARLELRECVAQNHRPLFLFLAVGQQADPGVSDPENALGVDRAHMCELRQNLGRRIGRSTCIHEQHRLEGKGIGHTESRAPDAPDAPQIEDSRCQTGNRVSSRNERIGLPVTHQTHPNADRRVLLAPHIIGVVRPSSGRQARARCEC